MVPVQDPHFNGYLESYKAMKATKQILGVTHSYHRVAIISGKRGEADDALIASDRCETGEGTMVGPM